MNINKANKPTPFDRLMHGLIAIPKDELEAEIAKEKREKRKEAGDGRAKPKK